MTMRYSMTGHLRQREISAARNPFSFTDPNDEPDGFDEATFKAYMNLGKSNERNKSGAWSRRTPSPRSYNAAVDSDVQSPKLWEQQSAKAVAIGICRQEIMDLVRDMPDSAYELSLKDMVELPRTGRLEEAAEKRKNQKAAAAAAAGKKGMRRSESMDAGGGFLLNMFLPFSLLGRKRSKSCGSSTASASKVAPKPGSGGGDRSSSSSTGSSKSSSSSGRNLTGCYSFLLADKSKTKATK